MQNNILFKITLFIVLFITSILNLPIHSLCLKPNDFSECVFVVK